MLPGIGTDLSVIENSAWNIFSNVKGLLKLGPDRS